MFQEIDWRSVLAIGLAGLASGLAMAAADRLPRATRALTWFGAAAILMTAVYAIVLVPGVALLVLGMFFAGNLALGFAVTTTRIPVKPADAWAYSVWANEIVELQSLGWRHLGTWRVDRGQTQPAMSILERGEDGTRTGMMGTAPQGGVISIDTLLDEGRGVLVTLRHRSATLRPPWMFRQELEGVSLSEMIKAHDEALFFLQTHGISAGGTVAGEILDFDRFIHRKWRRYVRQRWWLWAIRPLARRFQPKTAGPLHEQGRITSQIERYRAAASSEPSSVGHRPVL